MLDIIYGNNNFYGNAMPVVAHEDLEKDYSKLVFAGVTKDDLVSAMKDVEPMVALASEHYKLSANLKDYVFISVPILASEFPNRNGIAFKFEDLSAFDPVTKMAAYQTWKYSGCFVEHENKDPIKASGIVLDSIMKPLRKVEGASETRPVYTVTLLAAFDRNKNASLVKDIVEKTRIAYSMGAFAESFSCSVCGADPSKPCGHLTMGKPDFKTFDIKGRKQLAYWNAHNIRGFELSSVANPAYVSAINDKVITF